ncbi:MAG: PBP1A family penicillin-binding protein, partial [Caldilineae bacterium]
MSRALSKPMKRLKRLIPLFGLIAAVAATLVGRALLVDLPHPDQLYRRTAAPSTNIYDRHGVLLYRITDPHQGYHTPLALDDIPPACREATIATEDASFFTNPGFDTRAMLRALWSNVRRRRIVSGASTITQQLARNLLLSPAERTEISLKRKLREIILAWRITRAYSKEEILTLYLNETYYGNLAFGLEAAANTYFGKHAAELDLAECALLAGLPQSPSRYNPLEDLDAARARQADVLRLMVEHGFLSPQEAEQARREKLQFAAVPFPIEAPHFVMYVRGQLERRFGLEALYTQGLQVYTTLDLDIQRAAQRAVQYRLDELAQPEGSLPPRNVRNAAVVVLTPRTGEVRAMVGSPNYFDPRIDGNVNAAVALRQPGSSIKPITYAAAFDPALARRYGYAPLTPATMMMDVRTAFVTREGRPYVPQNYDHRWRGPVLLRQALASSYNLVAVKVLNHIGLEAMTALARQLGITTFDDADRFGLALTLGGGEVRLLELTAAYAAFASEGRRVEPVTILRVTDAEGRLLYRRQFEPGRAVLDPRTAFLITDILSDNLARAGAFGTGSPLRLTRPAAAKTGTTTDFRDNWTIGYTPDFVTGVWTGNADNEPMRHVSGITGAAPIWHDVMEAIHRGRPARSFPRPDGLVQVTVCAVNGLLPSAGCARTLDEWFIAGTEPTQVDDWHVRLTIDRRNGLLAGPDCPPAYTLVRWFVRYPVEAEPWMARNHIQPPPDAYSPLCP